MTALIPILVTAFNAAVDLEPSVEKIFDAIRNHPATSAAVKAQLDDLDARLREDESQADALPPVPDVPA